MQPLLASIVSQPWLIDQQAAIGYANLLAGLMNGLEIDVQDAAEKRKANRPKLATVQGGTVAYPSFGGFDRVETPGTLGLIPIRGEVMKYDQFCGPVGTQTIMEEIRSAEANPNIASIIFIIDSPGGQVTNTDLCAEAIRSVRKPTIAFAEGMMASAAYWIGSAADQVYASSDTDVIGSIGTMLYFADMVPHWEEQGVRFHEIYASKSAEKNKRFREVLSGDYDNYRSEVLDVLNEKFHSKVAEFRSGKLTDPEIVFTGKSFFAAEALQLGLIDGIASLHELITGLGSTENNNSNHSSHSNSQIMDRFTHVSALFDGLEITDEGAHLSPELLQALDDHLADQDIPNEPDAATLQRAQAAEGIVSQAAALLEPENDAAEVDVLDGIRNLLAENAALSAADGDDPTQIIKTADETDEEDPHAGFAHNRTADKLLI